MPDLFSSTINPVTETKQSNKNDPTFLSLTEKAKELVKEIGWVVTQRKTEYLDDLLTLSAHPSIQVRRKVVEALGVIGSKDIIEKIKKWQEIESDRKTWLLLEGLIDKLSRSSLEENLQNDIKILTVGEAILLIKQILGNRIYTIEGELGEVQNTSNGFVYFLTLKDKDDQSIRCITTEKVVSRVDFPLNEGLTVRTTGKFKMGKNGGVYLDIQNIELTGEGELLRNLKILEEKLKNEGLFDQERKRKIPLLPKKVLLVASLSSAALTDFQKVLNYRRRGVEIFLLPIKTQGIGAEREVLTKLSKINDLSDKHSIDTVVMTRGGGSKEDLFVFNSEKVVRAIYSINRPTIVAIGHERDTTLAESVADLRCSTPSQAAEKVSLSENEVLEQVKGITNYTKSKTNEKINEYKTFTTQMLNFIYRILTVEIAQARMVCNRTSSFAFSSISATKNQIFNIVNSIQSEIKFEAKNYKNLNTQLFDQINNFIINNLEKTKSEINLLYKELDIFSPQKVLEKGYAMILQKDKVVSNISQINSQNSFTIKMIDGEQQAKFEKKT